MGFQHYLSILLVQEDQGLLSLLELPENREVLALQADLSNKNCTNVFTVFFMILHS